jgi:hypothetical protein
MNRAAYSRLVEAIQTQSLICVQDALAELRALEEAQLVHRAQWCPSTKEFNWELTNARSDEDLTPMAVLAHLYAMKKTKGDTASCDRLEAIAVWLVEQGADPFLEQARTLVRKGWDNGMPVYVRDRGKTLVEVFGQSNLPQVVQDMIAKVNDSEGDEARVLRYHVERYGLAA